MGIPEQLNGFFSEDDFRNYPLIDIPQKFDDARGTILNIADGKLGDVAVIFSNKNSIRANHVHENDWHICYLLRGSMKYEWQDTNKSKTYISVVPGQMIFTPGRTPHKMTFLEESIFVTVSALSRTQEKYDSDTIKLPDNFFNEV
jgi:uncharacterized RmlC-like cupin family protein